MKGILIIKSNCHEFKKWQVIKIYENEIFEDLKITIIRELYSLVLPQ